MSKSPNLIATTISQGNIALGDRVEVAQAIGQPLRGVVRRIDVQGVASKADCYFILLDNGGTTYVCGDKVQPEVVVQRRPGRPSGQTEPLKKKDFRIPVRLLAALRAVADEEGTNDTQIILELLQSDARIQRKLEEVTCG